MTDTDRGVVAPGGTIGILGGGQLGRMTALAAARLGYRCHIYGPEADSPAMQVAATATVAAYDDRAALARFAAAVDVVTYEFENVPAASVEFLQQAVPVRPGPAPLYLAQNRLREKEFLNRYGARTAPYRGVTGIADLDVALAEIGRPVVLKSTMFGYDGKGQVMIGDDTHAAAAWAEMGSDEGLLEGFVDFVMEASVIVARGLDGSVASYVPVENRHRDHILHTTVAPAKISPELAAEAEAVAARIAEALDLVGLLAVELFVARDGHLLVNEIAPRPHNSGHWTIDACATSQFEQFVRAVCGLPLGATQRHSDAEMINLLGNDVDDWHLYLAEAGAHLHLYGKREARPGRKMGHVTRVFPIADTSRRRSDC
ncbi:MAG: 5-(carboxyamino)imidazole ribonucleotide synthase [Alphaproteobacteria bacterium]|nr:5-(carboxyamino)imidazole ribonucleotide synthase [Alphaproteobacteria bacterium]